MHTRPPSRLVSLRLMLMLLVSGLLCTVLLHRYVFALYIIEGSSMSPTLNDGDTALVNMLAWRMDRLDRGEIVLVRDGEFREYATKRIVGLPGERIDIKDGHVYLNGRCLEESYLSKDTVTASRCPTFLLGPDEYLVLGDNRTVSYDSRTYGPVSRAAIMGSYTRTFWACR